jgi:hypothetical protein
MPSKFAGFAFYSSARILENIAYIIGVIIPDSRVPLFVYLGVEVLQS